MRTLIVAPSWIGDAVLSAPLLRKLADEGGQIDVLAPPWVRAVYERIHGVAAVIDNPFGHGAIEFAERRALGKRLQTHAYDRCFVLPNSLKSALVPWFANIPSRIGYRAEARAWLLTDSRPLDAGRHPTMAQRFLALGSPRGADDTSAIVPPVLLVNTASQLDALSRLQLNRERPVLALCPGAEYGPAKRWPQAHFAALAREHHRQGGAVWIFGGPADRAISEQINQLAGGSCEVLAGRTTLHEAIDLLALAAHVVTNDSGLMHIACAVGPRVIALYGSSSPAFTPPLSPRAQVLNLKLSCSPCFERECPLGHFKCLNDLRPSQVQGIIDAAGA